MKRLTKSAARTVASLRNLTAVTDRKIALHRTARALERELETLHRLGAAPGTRHWRRYPAFLAWAKRQTHARCLRLWNRCVRLQCAAA
jgi:hypothetical protein